MYYTTFSGVDNGSERDRYPVLRIAPVAIAAAIAVIGWLYRPAQVVKSPTPSGQQSFSQSSQPATPSNPKTSTSTNQTGTATTNNGTSSAGTSSSTKVGGRGGGSGVPLFNTGASPTK